MKTVDPLKAIVIMAAIMSSVGASAGDRFGLWLEQASSTAVDPALALGTEVDIEVVGMMAETRLVQHFVNHTGQFAEGRYAFPLPDNVAVEHLEIRIGDRRIEGEIQERQQAERTYRQARDSGRVAGLVERERSNLFTTRVANIPPAERIEIRIGYSQPVDYQHGRFSLRFPTSVVPRFIPGRPLAAAEPGFGLVDATDRVPDAARITPPVHPVAADGLNPLRLNVDLAPGVELETIESSFHDIRVERHGGLWQVKLTGEIADSTRDFELLWSPAVGEAPVAAAFAESRNGHEHLLLMLTPPLQFQAIDTPREVILIIDTSGSMRGEPMAQAIESLQFALASLGAGDRFNVIEFNHLTTTLFDQPVPATDDQLMRASRWVDRLRAGGGTVMGPSLALAMRDPVPPGYLRQIVFITDGIIGNEREVLDQVHADIGDSRLFTVGIGHGVNSAFLREAAVNGRGTYTFIGEPDQISRRMSELVMQLEMPVLHDIELDWPGRAETHPSRLPDLYAGEPLVIAARLDRLSGDLLVRGTSAGQRWEETVMLEDFRPARGVASQWGRWRIQELQSSRGRSPDPAGIDAEILATALDYQLVSSRTSLVAVDRTPVRSRQQALAAHAVPTSPAHGREMLRRGMPATDAGTFASLVRAAVALLLIVLLFGHRRFTREDREGA